MKRMLICVALVLSLCAGSVTLANAEETPRPWESAYSDAISAHGDSYGNIFHLVDLDVDGTPELLIGGIPGSGGFSMLLSAFTYKDDQLRELAFPSESVILSSGTGLGEDTGLYTLYRNVTTGDLRVEGGCVMRAGVGNYSRLVADYSLAGDVIGMHTTFASESSLTISGSSTAYYVGGKKVSKMEYESDVTWRNRGWAPVGEFDFAELYLPFEMPDSARLQDFFGSYEDGPVLAIPGSHKITVDGAPVSISAYNIGGNNFFMLRDLACILDDTAARFEVSWDAQTSSILLTSGVGYTRVGGELSSGGSVKKLGTPSTASLYMDGRAVSPIAYNIEGNNYFKLRDMGDVIGFGVDWDAETSTVVITTDRWDDLVGTTPASITSDGGYTLWYGDGNLSAQAGYDGQCTWYAYGRFYELTSIQLKTARSAKYWLTENESDSRVSVVTDIQAPSVAVRTSGSFGHVMFVEHVEYDADGKPVTVYFTECNWDNNGVYNDGTDCALQKMTYEQFMQKRNPSGYIIAAN